MVWKNNLKVKKLISWQHALILLEENNQFRQTNLIWMKVKFLKIRYHKIKMLLKTCREIVQVRYAHEAWPPPLYAAVHILDDATFAYVLKGCPFTLSLSILSFASCFTDSFSSAPIRIHFKEILQSTFSLQENHFFAEPRLS